MLECMNNGNFVLVEQETYLQNMQPGKMYAWDQTLCQPCVYPYLQNQPCKFKLSFKKMQISNLIMCIL